MCMFTSYGFLQLQTVENNPVTIRIEDISRIAIQKTSTLSGELVRTIITFKDGVTFYSSTPYEDIIRELRSKNLLIGF